jgi:glycosyltransferase involved in cell wall biosynthesis
MKLLWLCNIELPIISKELNKNLDNYGGWLTGFLDGLKNKKDLEITVMYPSEKEGFGKAKWIKYYSFLNNKDETYTIDFFTNHLIYNDYDIIHIFGTEFLHSFLMTQVCKSLKIDKKIIINIQGLISIYSKHYYADLPINICKKFTIKEIIKKNNIFNSKKSLEQRSIYEINAIRNIHYVSGRTDWDKACCLQINSNINYFKCNEILRNAFYNNEWKYEKCQKHSIFVSQCSYPIKGFHKILEALPLIFQQYPDTILYTTGKNLFEMNTFERFKMSTYNNYLLSLIKRYKLKNNIVFLGSLNEEEMCKAYLNANVFVSGSAIENSPNSVGEAMLLGLPVISSDVGGVKNMLTHNVDGFIYPFNEYYMLSYYVCEFFKMNEQASEYGKRAKVHAQNTHNKVINIDRMLEIYNTIKNLSNKVK